MNTPKSITERGVRVLTAIGAQTNKIQELEKSRAMWIEHARMEGCSWRMIGVALGTTTQAAWERFSGHERDSEIPAQETLPLDTTND
jgi:hypothetical protein